MDTLIPSNIYSPVKHRYALACNEIPQNAKTVLDVGGYVSRAVIVSKFLPHISYTSLNVGSAWYDNECVDYLYDGITIPFADNSFEYVVCVDILEHIPSKDRQELIREMRRVTSKKTIIVTPFRLPERTTAESYILDLCERNSILPPPSLVEHEKYGLPYLQDIVSYAHEDNGTIKYATVFSDYWALQISMLWNTIAFGGKSEAMNRKLQEFQEKYHMNQSYPNDARDAYRCVLSFNK